VHSSTTHELRVYIYKPQQTTFAKQGSLDLGLFSPKTAIAANLLNDSHPDILLTLQVGSSSSGLLMVIYTVSCSGGVCSIANNLAQQPSPTDTYPTIMQLQGRNVVVYALNGKLVAETYLNGTTQQSDFISQYFQDSSEATAQGVCSEYLDLYYLDYNGDCLLDLVIHCNASMGLGDFQFYKGNADNLFASDKVTNFGDRGHLLRTSIADISTRCFT
jgi:hypothetical protein